MDQSAVLSIPFQTPFSFQGPLGLPGGLVYCPPMMTAATKPQIASDQSDLPDEGNSSKQKRAPMDKHLKRQIANSNERKRMQNINAGFHALRSQMPHIQGEKLSKAAILQHAVEYIYRLHQEKAKLLNENTALKMVATNNGFLDQAGQLEPSLIDNKVTKSSSPIVPDEPMDDDDFDDEKQAAEELEQIYTTQDEIQELRQQLELERKARMCLDHQNQWLQKQLDALAQDNSEPSQDVSRKNLDVMLKAIRQIEGDAFSRPATPRDAVTPVKSGFTSPRSIIR